MLADAVAIAMERTVPLLQHALPARLMLFPPLAIALVLAVWLHESAIRNGIKAAAVVLILLTMTPNLSASYWVTRVDTPKFFLDGPAQRNLSRNDIVLTLPWGNPPAIRWCGRRNAGCVSATCRGTPRWNVSRCGAGPSSTTSSARATLAEPELQLKAFLANNGVTAVAVDDANSHAARLEDLARNDRHRTRATSPAYRCIKLSPDLLLLNIAHRSIPALRWSGRAIRDRFAALVTAADEYVRHSARDPGASEATTNSPHRPRAAAVRLEIRRHPAFSRHARACRGKIRARSSASSDRKPRSSIPSRVSATMRMWCMWRSRTSSPGPTAWVPSRSRCKTR